MPTGTDISRKPEGTFRSPKGIEVQICATIYLASIAFRWLRAVLSRLVDACASGIASAPRQLIGLANVRGTPGRRLQFPRPARGAGVLVE